MDRSKRKCKKRVDLEELSEEQLLQLIDSVDDGDDCDSDDNVVDPDYVNDSIEPDTLEEGDEQVIAECIDEMNAAETTDAFIQAINLSLNLSAMEQPVASSTFVQNFSAVETVVTQEPFTSNATMIKAPKRARSPLPIIETNGPSVQPTTGGFTEGGMTIFTVLLWIDS